MRLLPAPVFFLLLASSLAAQSTSPIDVKGMLASLNDIKQKQTSSAKSRLNQTINDFSAAASSDAAAQAFYLEAVRVTQFVGQNREQTAFHDWKKREADKISPAAIRTCLRYTTLSLQRAFGATDQQLFPTLLAYAQDTQAILPTIFDQDIVRQPVSRNIFARWYNISDELSGLSNWELAPANVDGIYDTVLLPFMRKNRDPRVIQYWDDKIAAETTQASNAPAAFSTDAFNQNRRPELLWSRAEDMVVIDLRNQGLTQMFAIVKNFPAHPSAGKWIDELQHLLTTPSSYPPLPGAPSAPAAPAVPATGGSAAITAPPE